MNIKVFLPDSLLQSEDCFLRGFYVSRDNELNVYVTAQSNDIHKFTARKLTPDCMHGRYGDCGKLPRELSRNKIDVNPNGYGNISSLTIDRKPVNLREENVVIIFYDHDTLHLAENWESKDRTFCDLYSFVTLDQRLRREKEVSTDKVKGVKKTSYLLSSSVFCLQLKNFLDIMVWMRSMLKKDKRITLKSGNMLAALLTDILIGCLVLSVVGVRSQEFSDAVMGYIEVRVEIMRSTELISLGHLNGTAKHPCGLRLMRAGLAQAVVDYLRSLLKWLMGAPAGLKLNNAFNNMLGKFFLYHINLWWMFLELTKGGLQVVSQAYYYFGHLGITFQAAIISDMISFASFHAYCIYVYVARLFNIQVSGLAALLRLFVGRKRNPLRGGVDSCEYTNQELFVGTVAFTILLFLLPTTAMYYTVFTLFRVVSLAVQGALARLCCSVKTLPLYVLALYLIGSPRIAGNIHMEVLRDHERCLPLVLAVRFKSRALGALVRGSRPPPAPSVPAVPWTLLLSKIFKGNLISS